MANFNTEGRTTTQSALSITLCGMSSGMFMISFITRPAFWTRSASFFCAKAGETSMASRTTANETLFMILTSLKFSERVRAEPAKRLLCCVEVADNRGIACFPGTRRRVGSRSHSTVGRRGGYHDCAPRAHDNEINDRARTSLPGWCGRRAVFLAVLKGRDEVMFGPPFTCDSSRYGKKNSRSLTGIGR